MAVLKGIITIKDKFTPTLESFSTGMKMATAESVPLAQKIQTIARVAMFTTGVLKKVTPYIIKLGIADKILERMCGRFEKLAFFLQRYQNGLAGIADMLEPLVFLFPQLQPLLNGLRGGSASFQNMSDSVTLLGQRFESVARKVGMIIVLREKLIDFWNSDVVRVVKTIALIAGGIWAINFALKAVGWTMGEIANEVEGATTIFNYFKPGFVAMKTYISHFLYALKARTPDIFKAIRFGWNDAIDAMREKIQPFLDDWNEVDKKLRQKLPWYDQLRDKITDITLEYRIALAEKLNGVKLAIRGEFEYRKAQAETIIKNTALYQKYAAWKRAKFIELRLEEVKNMSLADKIRWARQKYENWRYKNASVDGLFARFKQSVWMNNFFKYTKMSYEEFFDHLKEKAKNTFELIAANAKGLGKAMKVTFMQTLPKAVQPALDLIKKNFKHTFEILLDAKDVLKVYQSAKKFVTGIIGLDDKIEMITGKLKGLRDQVEYMRLDKLIEAQFGKASETMEKFIKEFTLSKGMDDDEFKKSVLKMRNLGLGTDDIMSLSNISSQFAAFRPDKGFEGISDSIIDAIRSGSAEGLAEIFGGGAGVERAIKKSGISRMFRQGNIEGGLNKLKQLGETYGFTEEMAKKIGDSTPKKLERIINIIKEIGDSVRDGYLSKIEPVLDRVLDFLESDEFKSYVAKISRMVDAWSGAISSIASWMYDLTQNIAKWWVEPSGQVLKFISIFLMMKKAWSVFKTSTIVASAFGAATKTVGVLLGGVFKGFITWKREVLKAKGQYFELIPRQKLSLEMLKKDWRAIKVEWSMFKWKMKRDVTVASIGLGESLKNIYPIAQIRNSLAKIKFDTAMTFRKMASDVKHFFTAEGMKQFGAKISGEFLSIRIKAAYTFSNIKQKISSIGPAIKNAFSRPISWTTIRLQADLTWDRIKTGARDAFYSMKQRAVNAFTSMKIQASLSWDSIKTGFRKTAVTTRDFFRELRTTARLSFSALKSNAISAKAGIRSMCAASIQSLRALGTNIKLQAKNLGFLTLRVIKNAKIIKSVTGKLFGRFLDPFTIITTAITVLGKLGQKFARDRGDGQISFVRGVVNMTVGIMVRGFLVLRNNIRKVRMTIKDDIVRLKNFFIDVWNWVADKIEQLPGFKPGQLHIEHALTEAEQKEDNKEKFVKGVIALNNGLNGFKSKLGGLHVDLAYNNKFGLGEKYTEFERKRLGLKNGEMLKFGDTLLGQTMKTISSGQQKMLDNAIPMYERLYAAQNKVVILSDDQIEEQANAISEKIAKPLEAGAAWLQDAFGFNDMETLLEKTNKELEGIGTDTGKIRGALGHEQDLRWMKEMAEQRFVNRVNVRQLTPTVTVNVKTNAKPNEIGKSIKDVLEEEMNAGSNYNFTEAG